MGTILSNLRSSSGFATAKVLYLFGFTKQIAYFFEVKAKNNLFLCLNTPYSAVGASAGVSAGAASVAGAAASSAGVAVAPKPGVVVGFVCSVC